MPLRRRRKRLLGRSEPSAPPRQAFWAAQDEGGAPLANRYVAPGQSALLHWRLVGLVTVVGLIFGLAYGVVRPPKYTSTATVYVGKTLSLNNTAAIAGFALAAQEIAADYSRLISSSTVVTAASTYLGHHGDLDGTLSASPIPQTPEITITAVASSQSRANALANAGSKALVATVTALNATSSSQLAKLVSSYQTLEQAINQDQQIVNSLNAEINSIEKSGKGSSQVSGLQSQVATLQTTISTDTLQANAVQNQYQTLYAPLQQEQQVLTPLSSAAAQGSDRKKALELGAVVGIAAGLLLGVLIASLQDLRSAIPRRRVRPEPA
jgi:hypothetical protein